MTWWLVQPPVILRQKSGSLNTECFRMLRVIDECGLLQACSPEEGSSVLDQNVGLR
jgi:hypothetical protein